MGVAQENLHENYLKYPNVAGPWVDCLVLGTVGYSLEGKTQD